MKGRITKKLLALLLSVTMVMTLTPMVAFGDPVQDSGQDTPAAGTTNESLTDEGLTDQSQPQKLDKNDAKAEANLSTQEDYVAKIGSVQYKTLQEAVNATKDGDTVTLLKNVELSNDNCIQITKPITVDFGAYTVSGVNCINYPQALFQIKGNPVTFIGTTGGIDAKAETNGTRAIAIESNSKLIINSGVYKSMNNCTIYADKTGAALEINGGTIQTDSNTSGIFRQTVTIDGALTVTGGTIINNAASSSQNLFQVDGASSKVSISGANITAGAGTVIKADNENVEIEIKDCTVSTTSGVLANGGKITLKEGTEFISTSGRVISGAKTATIEGGSFKTENAFGYSNFNLNIMGGAFDVKKLTNNENSTNIKISGGEFDISDTTNATQVVNKYLAPTEESGEVEVTVNSKVYEQNESGVIVEKPMNFYKDAENKNLWHIANEAGWIEFAAKVNADNTFEGKTVILDNNLDMSTYAKVDPVGDFNNKPFKGTFDGNSKTISNINVYRIYNGNNNSTGVFGKVYAPAVIKDLTVTNATVTADRDTANDKAGAYVGGIAGHGYANISNCSFSGTVYGGNQVGGIAGSGGFTIYNCSFDGNIISPRYWAIGGIIGNCQDGGPITNNIAKGTITATYEGKSGKYMGGIVGCPIYNTQVISGNDSQINLSYNNVAVNNPIVGAYNDDDNKDMQDDFSAVSSNIWDKNIYSMDTFKIVRDITGETEWVAHHNGATFKVVAKIENKDYPSVAVALVDANSGDTIELVAASNENITLPVGVTFDTKGKSYEGTVSAPEGYFVKNNNGVYTITGPVAKIGVTGYEKFSDAVSAAKAASTTEGKTITIVGTVDEAYSFSGDCSGITFLSSETGKVTKGWTVQGNQTNMSNITIDGVKFCEGGNIVFSTAASDYSGLKIENCTFTGTGAESTPGVQIAVGDAPYAGIELKNNTISDFSGASSTAILMNIPKDNTNSGTISIEGNKATNFGHNGVQFIVATADLVIKDNEFTPSNNKTILNLAAAKSVSVTGNTFNVPDSYTSFFVGNDTDQKIVDITDNTFKKETGAFEVVDIAGRIYGEANYQTFVGYNLKKNEAGKYVSGYLTSYDKATTFPTDLIAEGYETAFVKTYRTDGSVYIYQIQKKQVVYEKDPVLLLKGVTSGKRAVKLSWNSVPGATKYVVYGQKCGKKFKKLKTTTGKTYKVKKISGKKLKARKNYKFYVVAYTAKGTVKSKNIHFITGNRSGKYANVKSIKAKVSAVTLNTGASKQIGATYKMYYGKKHIKKSHGAALSYVSNCPSVATVSSSGVVTAKDPGTATIYIQDIGGKYCTTTVTVK